MAQYQLDDLDIKILQFISKNARTPFLEIARVCEVSGAAIHQRVQRMHTMGVLNGSEYILEPANIGYETCTFMGIYLKDPSSFEKVVEELEKIPEVVECHYTTGEYDLFVKIYAKNNQHLLEIIHHKLQPLGLSRTESLISFKEAFRRQISVDRIQ